MIQQFRIFALLLGAVAIFTSASDAVERSRSSACTPIARRAPNLRDMLGASDRVDRKVRALSRIARSLAGEDAYRGALERPGAQGPPPAGAFTGNGLDLVWLFNARREFVAGATRDRLSGAEITITGFTPGSLDDHHPLLQRQVASADDNGGVVWTNQGQMAVSSYPVMGRDEDDSLGFIVVGRLLSRTTVDLTVARGVDQ